MTYKNLKNFKYIFERKDFDYISNIKHINEISEIILYLRSFSDDQTQNFVVIINQFLRDLESFYKWINGTNIPNLKKGYVFTYKGLMDIIRLLQVPYVKRFRISKGYLKKFNKMFLYGLSTILKGVRESFHPSLISSTNISSTQLVKYFLDDVEGISNKYIFNKAGKDSVVTKLLGLDIQELITAERLLLTLPKNQTRTTRNGWVDLGSRKSPVRILIEPSNFGRSRVCSLFRISEHKSYDKQLNMPPSELKFSAA